MDHMSDIYRSKGFRVTRGSLLIYIGEAFFTSLLTIFCYFEKDLLSFICAFNP